MYANQPRRCETATVQLSTDDIGRHWEHFSVEGVYSFSNQIPSRASFTTTQPGDVVYDRGLCAWSEQADSQQPMRPATAGAAGETAVMGLIMVICIALAGGYAWLKKDAIATDSDYHPMSDVPEMPLVFMRRALGLEHPDSSGDSATVGDAAPPTDQSTGDGHQESQSNEDEPLDIPWDDVPTTGSAVGATVGNDTVQSPGLAGVDGIDRLKGMTMKDFKSQLAANGVNAESGHFKSVDLIKFQDAHHILHYRMLDFWKKYGSTRVPFAVYYIFGLQNGGGRSVNFQQQYDQAKVWVEKWYSEVLGHVK